MNLTDREKEMLKAMIDHDQPLPPKYRLSLFADAPEVELIWQGKTSEVTNIVLPFQSIEQIDEPRAEAHATAEQAMGTLDLFGLDRASGRQASGWTNKLIWGDNKLVLSSLKNGPLRREIEAAGGLKLIYIDPPFDVGADFSFGVEIGNGGGDSLVKESSVIEELAYRDTWGRGTDSYLSMLYERLLLMHDLLADDGSMFVHCDWRVTSAVRGVLDEIFGTGQLRNEIIWCFTGPGSPGMRQFNRKHNTIWWYSKSPAWTFNEDSVRVAHHEKTAQNFKGGNVGSGFVADTYALDEKGKIPESWWEFAIAQRYPVDGVRRTGYATEKPFPLLERIVEACSSRGDLIGDFFCGSGTTLAVAEQKGRKWIGCDLGRFAIHTSRKRLIGVQRQLKAERKPYRAFEILNLGKYERQFFVGIDPTLPEDERIDQAVLKEEQYLSLILGAYKAERVESLPHVQGRKGATLVYVGPVDAPVTIAEVNEIVETCRKRGWSKLDIIAFEYEMGLHPYIQDEARAKGVNLGLKYIPKDVFDKRAIERNQVQFYDAAYVEAVPALNGRSVTVTLTDFGVFYGQDDDPAALDKLKPGGSKVSVIAGQVTRVSKDKSGAVTEERLTKVWTDWIDYWAIDFEFESKPEIIRVVDAEGNEREVRTGNFIFENEWQSFRTRKDRALELTSAPHAYAAPGRYKIAVKVIDIFGNDTTKVIPVEVA